MTDPRNYLVMLFVVTMASFGSLAIYVIAMLIKSVRTARKEFDIPHSNKEANGLSLELEKKVEPLRMITEAKLSYLKDHSKLLDQAFNELKEVHERELDLIYNKIKELDKRMDLNGLSKND